jgi:hypothetical protein
MKWPNATNGCTTDFGTIITPAGSTPVFRILKSNANRDDMSKIWQSGQLPPQHPEIDRKPQSPPVKRKRRKAKPRK